VLTAGIDLAAQPAKTGAVLVDWSSEPPTVVRAWRKVTDEQILALCEEVTRQQGRVGIDCPLGWPRPFVDFVGAHAANRPLPTAELGTQSLRLRATDIAVMQRRLGRPPLSVSTNMLGSRPCARPDCWQSCESAACRWTGQAGARSVRSIPPLVVPRGD